MFFVVESGELSVEVHGERGVDDRPGCGIRRDRADRPATSHGDRDRRERREGVRASRLRLQAVRRGAPAAGMEAPRGDGRPARRRRVSLGRQRLSELFEICLRPGPRSPDRLTVSAPATGSRTRPPKTTQRTPAREHSVRRRHLAPCPPRVVRSTWPSPVTTRSASRSRASKPTESSTAERPRPARLRGARAPLRGHRPRPRPASPAYGASSSIAARRRFEQRHGLGRRALLRPEEPRRVGERRPHVAQDRRRDGELAEHLAQPRAAVDGRASAEPDEERPTATRAAPRATSSPSPRLDATSGSRSVGSQERQPDRRCGLDDRAAVGQHEPARGMRPAERVGDDRVVPRAAERRVERRRRFPRPRRRSAAPPPRRPRRAPRARAPPPPRAPRGRP